MIPVPGSNTQVLDNRRFQNNPTIAELMMRMDAENAIEASPILREQLLARHPQLREVLETVHLPAARRQSDELDNFFEDSFLSPPTPNLDESLIVERVIQQGYDLDTGIFYPW
jgi:hypothetical protein